MEIERRFLVTNLNEINLESYSSKQIIQDYLYVDTFTAIRKRQIVVDGEHKYKYTIKTGKSNFSVNEIEKEISENEYHNLVKNPNYHTINKTRYIIPYLDDLIIELDVFHEEYDGLIFAEIEFKSEEQAKSTLLPNWFGKELSTKLTNSMMATMEIEEIKNIITQNA